MRSIPSPASRFGQIAVSGLLSSLLCLGSLFTFIPPALAESHVPPPQASARTSESPSPELVSDVYVYTLPSGQKLYVRPDHSQPIVTLNTWLNVGSVNETEEINGVSHFLEHLLFKGTDTRPVGEFERLIESKGGQFNAATSDDFTYYYITIASPFFEKALKLHADMLLNASIPEDELTRERLVVQEEINRANDNPGRQMYIHLTRQMYGDHGYANDTLGPKEVIAGVPRERILDYYHYWYRPENLHTIITGDVKPEEARALVEKYFDVTPPPRPQTYQPSAIGTPRFPEQPGTVVLTDPDISQGYLMLGFPGPSVAEPEEVYAMDMAMLALGSGKSSRLYRRLIEQEPLATNVSAGNYTQKYSGLLYGSATTTPQKLDTVKQELIDQIQQLKNRGITPEELEKTKTQYLKDFIYKKETTAGAARSLGYSVTIGTLEDYARHEERIRAVSIEDVKNALNQYLDFNRAVMVQMVPPSALSEQNAQTIEEKNLALLQAAAQPGQNKRPCTEVFAKREAAIQKQVFDDGLTLLSKPVPDSKTVAFKVFINGGQATEPKPGVAGLTAAMLKQGTLTRSAEQISEELESRGMGLSVSAGEDYLEVSGTAMSEDLGELFMILQDVVNNPTFSEAELEKQKILLMQSLQASRDNPSTVAFEHLTLNMYPDHPYGNVGQRIEDSLPGITRDDVVSYYRSHFRPDNIITVAVGNYQPAPLKAYVQDTFAPMQERAIGTPLSALQPDNPTPTLDETQVVETVQENLSAVWMGQGWLAPAIDSTDYVPLKVLNTVLGEGMSSRLFSNLREKEGLAYSVGSFYPSRKEPSRFVLYIGSDPANRERVREGFLREIETLKQEPLSQADLNDAQDKLIGGFALARETNAAQAQYLGMFEALGVGYEYDERYPDLIRQVTAEDIRRVAQKYFSQPSVLSMVVPAQPAAEPELEEESRPEESSSDEARPETLRQEAPENASEE